MKRLALTVLVSLPLPAFAADAIDVTRGPDTTVYGNCVPSLRAANRSGETIDYLEVVLSLELADGQRRTVELQSAYREGVLYPIGPGGEAALRQHLDTSRALGVQCSKIRSRTVERTICEAAGKPCAGPVSVRP
jgi:hypothetical protein